MLRPGSSRRLAALTLLLTAPALFAMDLSLQGGADYANFAPSWSGILGNSLFQPYLYYPTYKAQFSGEFASIIEYALFYENDVLFHQMLGGNVHFQIGYLRLGLGAFWAPVEQYDFTHTDPGLTGSMALMVPGVLFIEGSILSSAGLYNETDKELREAVSVAAGFYVPHVRFSAHIDDKTYTDRRDEALDIETFLRQMRVRFLFFDKPIPFTLHLDAGYQWLNRTSLISATGEERTDELTSLLAALGLRIDLSRYFSWFLEAEAGYGLSPNNNGVLTASASSGIILHIWD